MKKRLNLFLLVLFIVVAFISFNNSPQPKFYYAFNKKKTLTDHKTKLVVRFRSASSRSAFQLSVNGIDTSRSQKWADKRTVLYTCSDEGKQQDLLTRFADDANVVSVHPMVIIDQGVEAAITDEFVVQFNDGVSKATIDSLNKVYDVKVIRTSFYYLLQVQPKADVLKIANIYQETGLVKFSHPNFIATPKLSHIPNDPYFPYQFNFYNTGQVINDGHTGTPGADIKAADAWDLTTGSSAITIAVIDEGVTSDHPDLPNTRQIRLPGSNFGDGDPNDPSPVQVHDHGNSCAGLIGATQDNNEGISGLAPNCKIMPIRIFNGDGTGVSSGSEADAITLAYTHGADVISNSWGYNSNDSVLFPVIVTAIRNATTSGRNGLGSVVAFAAGNFDAQPGFVQFPACANVPTLLAVGASDRYDQRTAYSPTGTPSGNFHTIVDVVAPSHRAYPNQMAGETFEMWSLDIPGINLGYNSWPAGLDGVAFPPGGEVLPSTGPNYDAYTGRFGGTSAACPQVAGLAALILSVNPNLTAAAVYNQITSNADKVGGYTYTNGKSNEMGYGRINACASVIYSFTISGPASFCTSATYTIPNLPAGSSVTWSVSGSTGSVTLAPSGNSVTLTKVTDGDIYFGATVSGYCKPLTIGMHAVAGTPIPVLSKQASSNNCYYDVVTSVPAGSTGIQYSTDGSTWNNASIQYTANIGLQGFIERAVEGPVTLHYYVRSVNACGTGPSSSLLSVTIPKPRSGCQALAVSAYTVTLYPNPSSGLVTVTALSTVTSKSMAADATSADISLINVYSPDGRQLRHFEYNTAVRQATIDLSNLPSGNYLIEIGSRSFRRTQNLVLKH